MRRLFLACAAAAALAVPAATAASASADTTAPIVLTNDSLTINLLGDFEVTLYFPRAPCSQFSARLSSRSSSATRLRRAASCSRALPPGIPTDSDMPTSCRMRRVARSPDTMFVAKLQGTTANRAQNAA
jgi:hypothetical protein